MSPASPDLSLVVPVKTLSRAKQRLHDHPRAALMRGFALDTVAAALGSPGIRAVYVVTEELRLADEMSALGAAVLPDEGGGDLNAAVTAAVRRVAATHDGPVGALLGDLPCLRVGDLTEAVREAAGSGGRAHVPDAAGTGTTLLLAPGADSFAPSFGVDSSSAHTAAGHPAVALGVASLRRDVDTADDLADALRLGVGPHTRAVLDD